MTKNKRHIKTSDFKLLRHVGAAPSGCPDVCNLDPDINRQGPKSPRKHSAFHHSLFTGILCLLSFVSFGQTSKELFAKDIKVMTKKMSDSESFHAKTKVTVNVSGTSLVQTTEVKKSGMNTWVKTQGIENVFTPSYMVTVMSNQQVITYSKGIGKANMRKAASQNVIPAVDSALSVYDSIQFIKLPNGNKQYKLYSSTDMFSKIVLEITSDYKYKSTEYTYNKSVSGQDGIVAIEYVLWNEKAVINNSVFSLSNYLIKSGDSYTPAQKYKGFSVVENQEPIK